MENEGVECSQASKQCKENVCEKRFALKRKEEGMLCYTFFFFIPFFSYFCLHSAAHSRMKMKVMKESVGKICTYEVHVPHFVCFFSENIFFNYALVKISPRLSNALLADCLIRKFNIFVASKQLGLKFHFICVSNGWMNMYVHLPTRSHVICNDVKKAAKRSLIILVSPTKYLILCD